MRDGTLVSRAGDQLAQRDPVGTIELSELHLPDRMIIGRAGVHSDARQQRRKLQVVPTVSAPRAQLLHIRAIGTFENDRMPDGRTLGTTYRGELPNPGALPRRGAQLGDMWYTRNDGHTWVLAPIASGSQSVGWIDP